MNQDEMNHIIDNAYVAARRVFGYSREELQQTCRRDLKPLARHCVVFYIRRRTAMPYLTMLKYIKRSAHGTLLHSMKAIYNYIETKDKRNTPLIQEFMEIADSLDNYK